MFPDTIDQTTLEDLKHQANSRAGDLGHQLGPFRTAKQDPLCYVSFCVDCRQMVIVSLEKTSDDREGALYGYALEARCQAPKDDQRRTVVTAAARQ